MKVNRFTVYRLIDAGRLKAVRTIARLSWSAASAVCASVNWQGSTAGTLTLMTGGCMSGTLR